MAYIFSDSERSELNVARKSCPQAPNIGGDFVLLYQKLSEIISRHMSDAALDAETQQELINAKLWLDVAIGANGNTGMHSAFIRSYTNRQGVLRLNREFSSAEMQTASNTVATNLWDNLIKNWEVPAINEIAGADASAIGKTLFPALLGDTAVTANAAWSGAIGFNLLGGSSPWESWRLLTAGNRDSEKDGLHALAIFDRLDDLKNILFAVDAYDQALTAGFLASGASFARFMAHSQGGGAGGTAADLLAQFNIAYSSGKINPFIKTVVSGSPLSPYVNLLIDVGIGKVLDMLRRMVDGNVPGTSQSPAAFATNAFSFFNTIGDSKALGITLVDDSLAALAPADFGALMALSAASLFRFTGEESSALLRVGNPRLYEKWSDDQAEGVLPENLNFTATWRSDRAMLISALRDALNAHSGVDSQIYINDKELGLSFLLKPFGYFPDPGGGNPAIPTTDQVLFGSKGSDVLIGSNNIDHLYGADGNDQLEGGGDADYIEGNDGNDLIDGGYGADRLLGGDDNDDMTGGADNDTLYGGKGEDILSGGDGNDVLDGGEGDDLLNGYAGNDTLDGGKDNDKLYGGSGDDVMNGGDGDGNDELDGGEDNDVLQGGDGDDLLTGGGGADTLMGGDGYDSYESNDGDIIYDIDGVGSVRFNQQILRYALRKKGESVYRDRNGNTFVLAADTLRVNGSLMIAEFTNGDLGIYLDEQRDDDGPPPPPRKPVYDPGSSRFRLDPLALDLNGNGKIDTISSSRSSAYFDFNGDKIYEKAGWIAPGDGLLAVDLNDNGIIDDLSELFGTRSIAGFADLKQRMDINGDNMVDAADDGFSKLRIWRDANGDGVVQAGELATLAQLDITAIGLHAEAVHIASEDNVISAIGSFLQAGHAQLIADVELTVDFATTDSNPVRPFDQDLTLDADVYALPWLRGYGVVKSLHHSYQEDLSLRQAAVALKGSSRQQMLAGFEQFFRKWTGLDAAHQAKGVSHAVLTTDDKVWILASLTGAQSDRKLLEDNRFNSGIRWSTAYIDHQYAIFETRAALGFVMQASAKDWLAGTYYSLEQDGFVVTDKKKLQASLANGLNAIHSQDDAAFAAMLLARLKADEVRIDYAALKQALASSPYAQTFNQALDFTGNFVTFLITPGILRAPGAGAYLVGTGGADILSGSGGADVFDAGKGNDELSGGGGSDIYVVRRGDGIDTIVEDYAGAADIDVLRFENSISLSDIGVKRDLHNLYLTITDSAQQIIIRQRQQGYGGIERAEFADGTVLDENDLIALSLHTSNNGDFLWSGTRADMLTGLGGNDTIMADLGDDTLDGGTGNDQLDGGSGSDIYLYRQGDGSDTIEDVGGATDTIRFDASVTAADVEVRRDYHHLYLTVSGGAVISLRNWAEEGQQIEFVEFSDGTVWNVEELIKHSLVTTDRGDFLFAGAGADTISGAGGDDTMLGDAGNDFLDGNEGNDTLNGGRGDDTLRGGAGNDLLSGGEGNNVYLFGRGDGADTIIGSDVLRFDASVFSEDVAVTRDAAGNMYLTLADSSDVVRVEQWFRYFGRATQVQFADGATWDSNELVDRSLVATVGDDFLYGRPADDVISGAAGNDTLIGAEGADTLDGGAGNDLLDGGTGNDVYLYQRGDGADTIDESKSVSYFGSKYDTDTIRFGSSVAMEDIEVTRDSYGLHLQIRGSGDGVTISDWSYDKERTKRVEFADGRFWTHDDLLVAGGGHDGLYGTQGGDLLIGDTGNDKIAAGAGSDTLDGGQGADVLRGGSGNDVYLVSLGDGHDTIIDEDTQAGNVDTLRFDASVEVANVSVTRDGANLRVSYGANAGSITLARWLDGRDYRIERVEFANGVSWNAAQLNALAFTGSLDADRIEGSSGDDAITGMAGNDLMFGRAGADTLDAGSGDDTLHGDQGDDVLLGMNGDDILYGDAGNDRLDGGAGIDIFYGGDGNDTFEGGAGNDVFMDAYYGPNGNDVYLFKRGDGADIITYYYGYDPLASNTLRFDGSIGNADLEVFSDDSFLNFRLTVTGSDDSISGFRPSASGKVEFADGTIWSLSELIARSLLGTAGSDIRNGTDDNDFLAGKAGNDVLSGAAGDDMLDGGLGDDHLDGGDGADTLDGGAGNDTLNGGIGADVYMFQRGAGADVIFNYSNDADPGEMDTVRFDASIRPADVTVIRYADSLYLKLGEGDSLSIVNWTAGEHRVGRVEFADGTTWLPSDLIALAMIGTEFDDDRYGTENDDILLGKAGDDTLSGAGGDDILDGGLGNDSLSGGTGNDIYLFRRGDGADTIGTIWSETKRGIDTLRFDTAVDVADVLVTGDGDNLYLTLAGGDDRILITNWYAAVGNSLAKIEFDDGTVWSRADLTARALAATAGSDTLYGAEGNDMISGLAGDDELSGREGDDTLDGGSGNDQLTGGQGHDVYMFGRGDGDDTIIDTYNDDIEMAGNDDVLRFDASLTPDDIQIEYETGGEYPSHSLILTVAGTADKITIRNWWNTFLIESVGRLQQIIFADGTVWDAAYLDARTKVATAGDDVLLGTTQADMVSGLGGADILFGGAGDDTLDGGTGDDEMHGSIGNDVYVFRRGDGADTITDVDGMPDSINTIRFDSSISAGQVQIARDAKNVYLIMVGTSDRITLADYLTNEPYTIDRIEFADGTVWGASDLLFDKAVATAGNDRVNGTPGNDILEGLSGSDTLAGDAGADMLDGGDGADSLYGGDGEDMLVGGDGDDRLNGDAGDDLLVGGGGNDTLNGGGGNDIYLFSRGSGEDIIFGSGLAGDTLRFDASLNAADIVLARSGNGLSLSIHGSTDKLYLSNWFEPDGGRIERMEFSDGEVWSAQDMLERIFVNPGTQNDDVLDGGNDDDELSGLAGNDVLTGGGGNDRLYGGEGDDTLAGGAGVDILTGDDGSDVYLFGRGDAEDVIYDDANDGGIDRLRFDAALSPDDIIVTRTGSDIALTVRDSGDRITLGNWVDNEAWQSDVVEFGNGTIWYASDLLEKSQLAGAGADALYGTNGPDMLSGREGNDSLWGASGDDTLDGGAGDDYMDGGAGDDVYLVNSGDGADSIQDGDGNLDIVRFDASVDAVDVRVTHDWANLYLTVAGGQMLTLANWMVSEASRIERVEFSSGDAWDNAELWRRMMTGTSGSDYVTGTSENDTLEGGRGDDHLDGGAGDDVYIFRRGDGADTIQEFDEHPGNIDIVRFDASIAPSDIVVTRDDYSLYLAIAGSTDKITMLGSLSYEGSRIERVEFSDGTQWEQITMLAMASWEMPPVDPNQVLYGSDGDDLLQGFDGMDVLYGVAGNDTLEGGSGDDTLEGGAGDDLLDGGEGQDTYVFSRGFGRDSVLDSVIGSRIAAVPSVEAHQLHTGERMELPGGIELNAASAMARGAAAPSVKVETIRFNDILPEEIGVTRDQSDLLLTISSDDVVRLNDWFSSSLAREKAVQFDDGTVWGSAVLESLIEPVSDNRAMAGGAVNGWVLSSSMLEFFLKSTDAALIPADMSIGHIADIGTVLMLQGDGGGERLSRPGYAGDIQRAAL